MFIRPDENDKSFTGQNVSRYNLKDFVAFLIGLNIDLNTKIVVAPIKKIDAEWRFIVTDKGEIITGSQYELNGELTEESSYPDDAAQLASIIAKKIAIHPVFIIDICEHDGIKWVMEIGSVNCAGLYKCDLEKIIDVIERHIS